MSTAGPNPLLRTEYYIAFNDVSAAMLFAFQSAPSGMLIATVQAMKEPFLSSTTRSMSVAQCTCLLVRAPPLFFSYLLLLLLLFSFGLDLSMMHRRIYSKVRDQVLRLGNIFGWIVCR